MVLHDQKVAGVRREYMKINDIEIVKINGGGTITGSLIQYLTKFVSTIYEIGQEFGGAIRRIASNKTCPL